jgi:hypothetical protein
MNPGYATGDSETFPTTTDVLLFAQGLDTYYHTV